MSHEQPPDPSGGVPAGPPPGWYPAPGGQQVLRWWDGTAWAPHTQPMPGAQPGAASPGAGPGPVGQQQPGRRPPKGGGSHWVRNILSGIGAVVVVVFVLSHLSSGGSGGNGSTAAAGSPSAPAGSPSAAACTTHSCIASDVEQTLPGTEAKDGSVMTKVTCYKSTVKANPGDTYTVSCDVSYSDGEIWSGYATVLVASQQVTWEPENEI